MIFKVYPNLFGKVSHALISVSAPFSGDRRPAYMICFAFLHSSMEILGIGLDFTAILFAGINESLLNFSFPKLVSAIYFVTFFCYVPSSRCIKSIAATVADAVRELR